MPPKATKKECTEHVLSLRPNDEERLAFSAYDTRFLQPEASWPPLIINYVQRWMHRHSLYSICSTTTTSFVDLTDSIVQLAKLPTTDDIKEKVGRKCASLVTQTAQQWVNEGLLRHWRNGLSKRTMLKNVWAKYIHDFDAAETAFLQRDDEPCTKGAISMDQSFHQKREADTPLTPDNSKKPRTNSYSLHDGDVAAHLQSDTALGLKSLDGGKPPYNLDTIEVQRETEHRGIPSITLETPSPLELSQGTWPSTQETLADAAELQHESQPPSSTAGTELSTSPRRVAKIVLKPIITTFGLPNIAPSLSQHYPKQALQPMESQESMTQKPRHFAKCVTSAPVESRPTDDDIALTATKHSPYTASEIFRRVGKILIPDYRQPRTWVLLHVDTIMLQNLSKVFVCISQFLRPDESFSALRFNLMDSAMRLPMEPLCPSALILSGEHSKFEVLKGLIFSHFKTSKTKNPELEMFRIEVTPGTEGTSLYHESSLSDLTTIDRAQS